MALLLLVLDASPAAEPAADAALPVVHFHNGDYLAGRLEDCGDRQTILWRSDAFAAPLRLAAKSVQSVQFPPQQPQIPAGPYCFELAGGDLLYGALVGLDEQQATIVDHGLGTTLRVQRAALVRLFRMMTADLLYIGPMGIGGWTTSGPANAWRDEGGRLSTDQPGAVLRRDFSLSSAVRYELELSWSTRPNFELAMGVDDDPTSAARAFRLEVWKDDLVVVRETDRTADVAAVQKLSAGAGRCQLQIWLDYQQGHLLVFSPAGEKLAELRVPSVGSAPPQQTKASPYRLLQAASARPRLPSGWQLTNRRGDIKLERLTVSRASNMPSSEEPSKAAGDGKTAIERVDGKRQHAQALTYDSQTHQFIIGQPDRQERLDEAQVQEVTFSHAGQSQPRSLRVLTTGGARLSGELVKVDQGRVWLECPGFAEPVAIDISQVHALVSLEPAAPSALPKGEGRLEGVGLLLHGQLVDSAESGLRFKPRHVGTATPLSSDISARLVFRDPPPKPKAQPMAARPQARIIDGVRTLLGTRQTAPPRVPQPGQSMLHLRSGDFIPCQVLGIDESGVSLKSELADAEFVPHDRIKALELRADVEPIKIDKTKRDRLLTLPRMQRDNPPTQLFRSLEGDYLRGRLLAMDDRNLQVELQLETETLARDQVARIIWLHADEMEGATPAPRQTDTPSGMRVQAVPRNGNRLTFFAQRLEAGTLSGTSEVLGDCRVDLDEVDLLLFGNHIEQAAASLTFHSWKLVHAPEPLPAPDGDPTGGEGLESVLVGKPAPDIELDLLDGQKFRLADHKNKVLVLDFWASWCGPCLQAMPQVDQVAREFADRDVKLVAINLQETPDRVRTALERLKLETVVALDRDGRVAERYGATSIPQTVIVDRQGKVARLFVGAGSRFDEQLRQALTAVLNPEEEPPVKDANDAKNAGSDSTPSP